MIDRRALTVASCFCVAVICFAQSQTPATPQQAKSSTTGTPATTGAPVATTGQLPPPNTTTTGAPPPPPVQVGNLTPPIQPKTTTVQEPPNITLPGPPTPTPGVSNAPLTAEEAAQIALVHQPNVAIALAQVAAAKGMYVQQQSALYPQLNFTQGYSLVDQFYNQGGRTTGTTGVATTGTTGGTTTTTTTGTTGATTGTTAGTTGTTSGTTSTTGTATTTTGTTQSNFFVRSSGFSGDLSLTQLIFDFNHTRDLVRQFGKQVLAAQNSYTKAQIDTILTVKTAFYTYVQDQGLVGVQEANVASTQASLNLAQAELTAGLGAPADVVAATTTYDAALQSLLQARATEVTAQTTLCLDMGIDPRTPIVPATSSEPTEPTNDVNSLVSGALKNRPDVKAAEATYESNVFGVSAARTANAPAFTFQVDIQNFGNDSNPLTSGDLVPSINVVWPIWDSGKLAGEVETAKATAEISKQQLQSTVLSAIQDVANSWVNVKNAEQRVTVANGEVDNATENLRLAQGQYAAGVTPFVTVITAQATMVQANSDKVNAIANLNQARATLTHSLGH